MSIKNAIILTSKWQSDYVHHSAQILVTKDEDNIFFNQLGEDGGMVVISEEDWLALVEKMEKEWGENSGKYAKNTIDYLEWTRTVAWPVGARYVTCDMKGGGCFWKDKPTERLDIQIDGEFLGWSGQLVERKYSPALPFTDTIDWRHSLVALADLAK